MTERAASLLPHGGMITPEDGLISVPLGPITLHFTLEEWDIFTEMIDDINAVLQANSDVIVYECEGCGSSKTIVKYVEPEESEFN